MKTMQLRDAKGSLPAVFDAAERSEATTIARHDRPAAVVVRVGEVAPLYRAGRPSFAALLMSVPEDLETPRDPSRLRDSAL